MSTTVELVEPARYAIGAQPILIAKCKDRFGADASPSGIRFVIQRNVERPGTPATAKTYIESSSNVALTAVGRWECTLPLADVATPGRYDVHIYGTGVVIGADQGCFYIDADVID